MWVKTNENPVSANTGDCAVRAISIALGISWEKAYTLLSVNGFLMGLLPDRDAVWSSVLRQHGFKKHLVPNCPDCYTVREFCMDYPRGTYVLKCEMHVLTVIDGSYYDSWDSGNEPVLYFWSKED